ncbi:MAG: metallophosphoesterase [Acetivibrionales bacterium]|jgi:UDP-2,3-diacylglucosamine pyrophosphatase LpxH
MTVFNQLTRVLEASPVIPFDDSSKLVFMSDCHRGDGSWADDFARNQNLFKAALNYYYKHGFTYIEVGDGDELWENASFEKIMDSHMDTFRIIKKFQHENRLYMIWGNHDRDKKAMVCKNLKAVYNPAKIHEGIILKYKNTARNILVTHGHQGDFINDSLWPLGRFLVRYFRKTFEMFGLKDPVSPARNNIRKKKIEGKIINWVKKTRNMIIAGHTHRPVFAMAGESPYFNDGSCVFPYFITAIEIQNGEIALVKWSIQANNDGLLFVGREYEGGPKKLIDILS